MSRNSVTMESTSTAGSAGDPNLTVLWESLVCLVKPASETGEVRNLRTALQTNLKKAASVLGFEDPHRIPHWGGEHECGSDFIWDFVETAVFLLSSVKNVVKDDDLSVSQKKTVSSCLQFIVSLGILPNILPGVTHTTSADGAMLELLSELDTTLVQKYERLCIAVKALLSFCDSSNFRPLIITNVIHYLLGALIQLSYAPVKKPTQDTCNNLSDQGFTMTFEFWERLQSDKQHFRALLNQLIRETYQPKIMLELMVLQGGREEQSPPLWLKKSSSNLLTTCLIQPGGVAALIRATFDTSPDTGSDWKKTDTLAKIITSPVNHLASIGTQLLKLINAASHEHCDMLPIAVACICQLLEKDPISCHKFIIDPLLEPLAHVFSNRNNLFDNGHTLIPEEKIDSLVKQIHACFAMSTSKVSSGRLPGSILAPFVSFFFKLFCKLHGSVSVLFKYTESIMNYILCDSNQQVLRKILKCILLEEEEDDMFAFPRKFGFSFGSSGGVYLQVISESPKDMFSSVVEDHGDIFMILLEKRTDVDLSISVFEVLLQMLVERGMKPKTPDRSSTTLGTVEDTLEALMLSSEKHLGIVRLLAALVENANVKQKLSENPGPVLTFIGTLFDSVLEGISSMVLEEDEDLECLFVAFMILNVILDRCDGDSDWSVFGNLLKPVSVIKDRSKNEELKRLASRAFLVMSTCGAAQDAAPCGQGTNKKTKCAEALHDACDPLLPVRGHALVQLTKLLQLRDRETLSKKEAVFCLFKENLNNCDSYIYLAAINGIVAFAAIQPDDVVNVLTREYIEISSAGDSCPRDPELRMKVGEILVKLVRELGAMAPKYKNELLNAFLAGSKDTDNLMRASSLSNLGEVCEILGFRVGPILRELLLCIQSIVKFDKAVEPRRASVMVVTHLLRGLDASALNVLQDAVLELYRSLKFVYSNDEDDVVRLHAQLALEELASIAKEFLFPKLPMEKKIQIL